MPRHFKIEYIFTSFNLQRREMCGTENSTLLGVIIGRHFCRKSGYWREILWKIKFYARIYIENYVIDKNFDI